MTQLSNPTSGDAPLTVTFSMSASDTDGTIANWELDIDNDGTAEYSGSGEPPATQQHTYNDPGNFTAELTVWDDDGDTGSDTAGVSVNDPPTATLTANPASGDAPLTVTFTDLSTGDVTSWDWDFGDGGTSTDQNPVYQYQNAGNYTVSLTVTGPEGSDIETKANYISVYDAPVADFVGSPTSGGAPLTHPAGPSTRSSDPLRRSRG